MHALSSTLLNVQAVYPLQVSGVFSACSSLLSWLGNSSRDVLRTLHSSPAQGVLWAPAGISHSAPWPGSPLMAVSWGDRAPLVCFSSLRDHSPASPHPQCIENSCFAYFCPFRFCFFVKLGFFYSIWLQVKVSKLGVFCCCCCLYICHYWEKCCIKTIYYLS